MTHKSGSVRGLGAKAPRPSRLGAEPLQVVVEVRQVAERDGRGLGLRHAPRGDGDPARGADVGGRPPEVEERKPALPPLQVLLQVRRVGVQAGILRPSAE